MDREPAVLFPAEKGGFFFLSDRWLLGARYGRSGRCVVAPPHGLASWHVGPEEGGGGLHFCFVLSTDWLARHGCASGHTVCIMMEQAALPREVSPEPRLFTVPNCTRHPTGERRESSGSSLLTERRQDGLASVARKEKKDICQCNS